MGRIAKDYTGVICGCWEVIERDLNPKSKSHETFWISKCLNCGEIASVRKSDLDKKPRSCNNCKGNIISETLRLRDSSVWQIGDRYGKLTIIGKGEKRNNNSHHTYVKVQCDCGTGPFEVRLEHLKGQCHSRTISCGCASESAGELKIRQILENKHINFKAQYRIQNMVFDFVILNDNNEIIKCIEFNGRQHYEPIDFFGGEEAFKQQQIRDSRKIDYCASHGIKLQWIPYYDFNNITSDYLI
jgi:hypothetical protein